MTTHTIHLSDVQIEGLSLAVRLEALSLDASPLVRKVLINEADHLFEFHGGRSLSLSAAFANSFVPFTK